MKLFYKIITLLMSLTALLVSILPGSNSNPRSDVDVRGSFTGFGGEAGTSTEMTFESETAVNCAVIREKGMNIKGFLLEALVNGQYTVIAGGDTVGEYRFCDFNGLTASSFRFTVTDCAEGGFTVKGIDLCERKTADNDFRVVSYLVADNLNAVYKPDTGRFTASTDIIIFGIATFDENGEILLKNEENLPVVIENCRESNPSLRIHLNILGPSPKADNWDDEMQLKFEKHALGMQKNRTTLIQNIVTVLDKYGFDGVYFDYEFPVSSEAKLMFSSFLVALDKQLGDKELGAAMASWCCLLSPAARRALDNVEIMAYDLFDTYGYHAAFNSAYNEVKVFLNNGYKKEQLHLGLPFYARPTDGAAKWPGYNEHASKLGEYQNLTVIDIDGNPTPVYFNSRQLIRDKTAYALSAGLNGIMIWHLSCDTDYESPYSLYRTIDDTLAK